jgi:hypothetical protein
MNKMEKKCSKCKILKDYTCFHKDSSHKNGIRSRCIECSKQDDKIKTYRRKHYLSNKVKILQKCHDSYFLNMDIRLKAKETSRKSYLKNRDKVLERGKLRRELKNEEIKKRNIDYYKKRNYKDVIKERRKTDQNALYRNKYGNVLRKAIKNDGRSYIENIIGCDISFFKTYISSKFKKCMNWDNYGKHWQLDHIYPCSSFDLSKEEDRLKCFNYKNYQPLTIKENLQKHTKIINNENYK